MKQSLESYLYILDAWNRFLRDDPGAVVLSDSLGHDCSRAEADELSDRVHAYLQRNGVGRNDVVLLRLERGVKPVIAILGVIKAGAAFTLVEDGHAAQRTDFIRRDCGAKFELNETNWGEALACDPVRGYERPGDHDLALCVYTSGTGGNPKGVAHEYGQYKLEMISEMQADGTWRESAATRWGLVAPLHLVASLKILVHFLYCGGHLYVIDYDTVKNPARLRAYFLDKRINETFLPPSLLRLMGTDPGPFMRCVYTGAEPADHVFLENCRLINTYTMSESFFTVSEFAITRAYDHAPIGRPLFDLGLRLLDEHGKPVAEGETGEVCFESPYCRGYLNLPVETEAHFADGCFHTGDLAVLSDGVYLLKGRNDDMIKIDGNRIEPSEIEAACKKALGLGWCAARGFEAEALVALYYTDPVTVDEEAARELLAGMLPYYMIPARFVCIDEVPLTASGKLNRRALPLPAAAHPTDDTPPRNALEQRLTEVMASVLGLARMGVRDDFFQLGGTSIRAMEALEQLGVDGLTVSLFYRGRTAEKIAALYAAEVDGSLSDEEKEALGRAGRFPLPPLPQYMWDYNNDATVDFCAAYQLSPLVSLIKLRDTLRAYMELNSSFHLILEQEDHKALQVYAPTLPPLEIETMTEREVEALRDDFLRPFVCGAPLYRLRLIRTGRHSYLFCQLSHMLTDGAGVRQMLRDMETLYQGGAVRPTYYFANAYEQSLPAPEAFRNAARAYYESKLDYRHRMGRLVHDHTGQKGSGTQAEFSFPLEQIDRLTARYHSSCISFVHLAVCLAMEQYNGKPSFALTALENRSPNENPGGMRVKNGGVAITTKSRSLPALFADMDTQQYYNIRYAAYDFGSTVFPADGCSNFYITYIGGWFDPAAQTVKLGKALPLHNRYKTGDNSTPILYFEVRHENGRMVFRFAYDRQYLTEEHAGQFVSLVEFAGNELLAGRYPQFPAL